MEKVRQFYLNMKLRKKLYYSYIIVSIIPILILGYSCYRHNRNSMVKLEEGHLEESFNNAVADLNYRNESYVKLSNSIVFNTMITNVVYHEYKSYYEMYEKYTYDLDPQMVLFQNLHEEISQISIYTTNPTIIQHGQILLPMEMAKDKSWYPADKENNQMHWESEHQNTIYSVINFPEDEVTNIQSVLCIQYNYQKYFKSMEELSKNECGVRVVDDKGQLIYESDHLEERYQLGKDVSLDCGDKELINNGRKYMVLSMPVQNTEWTAYVYKPMHLIMKSARDIIYIVVMLVFFCLLLVMLVARNISGILIRPIERLSNYMQNMDMNNLCVTLVPKSQDEIGTLITSFQLMIHRIQTLIQDVYKAESDRKKFEIQALQAQINPHFLYNCLSLINWKAIMADEKEISQMAQFLSEFYRTSLNKGKSFISVNDELRNVESYIEIQNILHNYTLEVEYDIEEEVCDYSMINLTLQPIVENAIIHGLDNSRKDVKRLVLKVKSDETDIQFTVEDNGCGMPEEMAATILEYSTKGYGVKNVNDRLMLIYGKAYGVTYETGMGIGTKVIIRIPKRYEDGRLNEK